MKNSPFLTVSIIASLFPFAAGFALADSFDELNTPSRPTPLERSGGAYVALGGSDDWVFLLHGGLPSALNPKPVDEVWVLDGSEWRPVDIAAPAVYGHTVVPLADGRAIAFGGIDDNDNLRSLDTLLSYQIRRGSSGLEVTVDEIAVAGSNPGKCSESPVVRLEERDSMLLIGGMCSYFPGRSEEVWEYRVESNDWQRRADLPRALADHSAVVANGQVWVFGGIGPDGRVNDVFRYDPQSDTWAEVQTSGNRPEAMSDHRAVAFGDSMVVFGGTRAPFFPETIAEVWELKLSTRHWTRKTDLPYGLAEMVAAAVPPDLYGGAKPQAMLFGGVIDAWSFPLVLSDRTWIYSGDNELTTELLAIPSVARIRGKGAFFTSTLFMLNLGDIDLDLELTYTPRMDVEGPTKTAQYVLAPGTMKSIKDPLATLFAFGADDSGAGSLLIEVVSGSANDLLMQTFVTAEVDSGEEYGTYFPAIRGVLALTPHEVGCLTTTEDPSSYRVNVGLMAIADSTKVAVAPATRMGEQMAGAVTFSLDAGENIQINDVHRYFGVGSVPDLMIEVTVDSGRAVAYATVLDGKGTYVGTSDPTTVLPTTQGSERVTLLEIGSIQGIDEFAGSATLVNHSVHRAELRAEFYERGKPGVVVTQTLNIDGGEAIGYGDLVGEVFGISDTVGTVVLEPSNGARISATGREFALLRDQTDNEITGTAGTALPGLTTANLLNPDHTRHIFGLRQKMQGNTKERSHLAVFNPGPEAALMTVLLFNGNDGEPEGSRSWTIEGQELIHINGFMKKINTEVDARNKRVEIVVDHPVYLHAFRVNTWGDSVTMNGFDRSASN